jgi:aerotaxis receptor
MKGASPTGKEKQFEFEELFYSVTDEKGKILDGNKTFSRLSEWDRQELIGEPHNIIRHPDMPKAVFYLLWETISKGEIISAYVKNKAKNGDAYWVVATVFPLKGNYLSIRFRPSTALMETVRGVYQQMLEAEKQEKSIDAGVQVLVGVLNGLGIDSYAEFMTGMLVDEMIHLEENIPRKRKVTTRPKRHLDASYIRALQVANDKSKALANQFKKMTHLASDMYMIAMNAGIASSRLENKGRTLEVLAERILQNVTDYFDLIKKGEHQIGLIRKLVQEAILRMSCMNLSGEMMERAKEEGIEDLSDLEYLFLESFEKTHKTSLQAQEGLFYFDHLARKLSKISMDFKVVNTVIKKEVAINDALEWIATTEKVAQLVEVMAGNMDLILDVNKETTAAIEQLESHFTGSTG